ncbi:copper amine oxidase N-terminal domain-containing protein [Paenibacillus harenae]|uniref:Copper amine oxidase-like N-terminal domain-containing protein n=1 Tax=Paenibacillus harenae TaxID=306543 RepID=A0ABT9U8X1_PAEHA|nr:copper amine oxidase N-terminal domain-containing protein [Paenibacillus harenae]MDQ0114899.1 hypothetical protein [Paenibacillus harenae]
MRIVKLLMLAALLALTLSPKAAYAAENPIAVYIQDEELSFDQPPVITSGRVLVPFRPIAEGLGVDVSWDSKTKQVTAQYESPFKSKIVTIPVNGKTATVDGAIVSLDVPAKIINGRIMVPIRFLTQSFGAKVNWNSKSREIDITIWELKDTVFNQFAKDGSVVNTYTESGFNQKLSNMYDNEELVATSKWTNLMDPGKIGVVAQHYGFFLINGKYHEISLVLDGELNKQGNFDGDVIFELYDDQTGEFVDSYYTYIEDVAYNKVVKYNVYNAVQAAGWE